ncbi:MAG: helix-turn-helix domain-containing protein [Synergistaceae bacterium]|nr:helix-turn-helix domain-containing protein [Synergistaceae bacterium]
MSETIGERLRRLRKKSGLTQPELADLVGVHETTIRRWENEGDNPSIVYVSKLAKALGVSEADLLNDSPDISGKWLLSITVRQELKEEVIDLSKPIPEISTIITANTGAYIALGGSYEHFLDDTLFKGLIAQLKKMRDGVIQQGKANGAIPDDSKKRR